MENLNVRENNDSQLSGASGQYFNEREYEEQNLQIKKERATTKEQDEVRRSELISELLGDKINYLSTNESRGKIEGYLQGFQNDPDFPLIADMFSSNKKINHESLQWDTLNAITKSEDRLPEPLIYQAAALLLANCEKGYSPYRGLTMYENGGLWIKVLLGKNHYNQFLIDKKNCIYDIQNGSGVDRRGLQDDLATCEMDYIVNNIRGSNGQLQYFGFHEDLPGVGLPSELADRLASLKGWLFNRSSVIESYEKIVHTDFDLLKYDFEKFMGSARFPLAFANLARMLSLARNDEQKSECQKCLLICMLSGVLDINGQNDIKKQVYQWGKSIGFLPGMLAKNIGHSEQVVELLDDFSKGDFSKKVKSFFHQKDLVSGGMDINNLIHDIDAWWSIDRMYEFARYTNSEFLIKEFPSGSILNQLQRLAQKSNLSVGGLHS